MALCPMAVVAGKMDRERKPVPDASIDF